MTTSGVFARVPRRTVLFVDGDPEIRLAYQRQAARKGFRVALAADGDRALTLAKGCLPDVIVLDLGLPGMGGVEVARRLRASGDTRAIPIVATSEDHGVTSEAAVRASGCDGHLVKPCPADVVVLLAETLAIGGRPLAQPTGLAAGAR